MSSIYIKPSKRGSLRKAMKAKEGEKLSVSEMTKRLNSPNTSSTMKKKLNFAINARKWNHENGGMLPDDYYDNYMLMPEYGFGSWLKENAGGLLSGAGSLASLIPGVGQIAGPVLNIAGSVISKNQQDKLMASEQQKLIDEQEAAAEKAKFQSELATRQQSLFGGIDKNINYGETFAYGGGLMTGMEGEGAMPNPQITEYSQKADLHSEGIGGIPVDAKGNPTSVSKTSAVGLTEGGEVTWNGYVFSNRLKVK